MFDFGRGARGGGRGHPGRRVVGLDAGERRTKLVVVEGSSAAPRVVSSSDLPTPPGLVAQGRPARPAELVAWLRRVLADHVRPGDPVWMACPWPDAQVKRLSVADAANRDATLRGLAVNPAFRTSGGDGAPSRLDYHVTQAEAGAVMAVAARPEGVRALAQAATAAGADVRGVSVTESALVHAWLCSAEEPEARAVLLEGGHAGVTLVVMDGGEPVAFRRVMYGGRMLEERGAAAGAEAPPPLVEEWSGRIAQEVRMVAGAAFRGAGGGVPPVVVMGGLGRKDELVDGLAKALGGAVKRWTGPAGAWAEEAGGGEQEGEVCGLAVALGLAVQGLAADEEAARGPALQLMRDGDASERGGPSASPVAVAKDRRVRLALGCVLLAALLCQSAEVWLAARTRAEKRALVASQLDSVRVQGDIARTARLEAERGRLGGAAEQAERLRAGAQAWPRLMDRLSRAIPANAWADSLVMDTARAPRGGVRFRVRGYAGTAGQVSELERALRGGAVTESAVVSMTPVSMAGLTLVRWTIVGVVGGDPQPNSAEAGYGQETANAGATGR